MKILNLVASLLVLAFAGPGLAAPFTGNGAARFHVHNFEMWDDGGFGFTFGRYESGLAGCVLNEATLLDECNSNGYVHLDRTVEPLPGESGVTAVYWFVGPAYDLNGVAIPGTEDDEVTITAGIALKGVFDLSNFGDYDMRIMRLTVEGSSLEFVNGVPINVLTMDFSFDDEQKIGEISPYFTPNGAEFFNGFVTGSSIPHTMMVDTIFGIHYQQDTEGPPNLAPIENIPVPEPGFVTGLAVCAMALIALSRMRWASLALVMFPLVGCVSIHASIKMPQVADEGIVLGMEREDVDSVLRATSYTTQFGEGQLVEYRYEDSDASPYRSAIYFPFGPFDVIFAPVEYWIHRSAQRWANGIYNVDGELVYFVSNDADGDAVIQLGGPPEPLEPKPRMFTAWDAIRGPRPDDEGGK
jgi:hypothetical protein